jgi:osmoprotectant transport system ATP-binding protein
VLQLEKVSKAYSGKAVIHGLDLQIESGKTTVLIGPSGCGKSTILRLMLGLIYPDSGRVSFNGTPLHRSEILRIRRQIGYVVQDGGLFPHLTAARNITLMAKQLRWERPQVEKRLSELTAITKFPEDGLQRYPVELSGGQRQRVALMRALMLDPVLLLLDEPLGALDPMIRFDLQTDLRQIFRTLNKTTVMVTHDLAEAAYFADRIVLLQDGRIEQEGAFKVLAQNPANDFVARFFKAQRNHLQDMDN